MKNSTYVMLGVIIILVVALSNVIDVSSIEKPVVKETPISKTIPEIKYVYITPTPIETIDIIQLNGIGWEENYKDGIKQKIYANGIDWVLYVDEFDIVNSNGINYKLIK